jgi:hypothetical protein
MFEREMRFTEDEPRLRLIKYSTRKTMIVEKPPPVKMYEDHIWFDSRSKSNDLRAETTGIITFHLSFTRKDKSQKNMNLHHGFFSSMI